MLLFYVVQEKKVNLIFFYNYAKAYHEQDFPTSQLYHSLI